ncbi:MAG TPA: TfuA-related McrA-glycine thioamidation protein [Methanosarcinaceae archaeon]|nr:TfuA-related McrA-glycine thioamidation protein [Methanosarcinaceae archaeon]
MSKVLRPIIFAGTSISHEDAKNILDVEYSRPVFRCDIRKAVKRGYNVIGIIDGIFFDKTAVAHKEITKALKSEVIVVGGCSMGALRASELDTYGMIGVGKIYEWYRDGVIEADDEVAVATNPDTFEPVSNPMVNIRETFNAAYDGKIIDSDTHELLMGIAKKTHYTERTYFGVVKQGVRDGVLSSGAGDVLIEYCKEHEVDVKRNDAIAVIEKIKEILGSTSEQ